MKKSLCLLSMLTAAFVLAGCTQENLPLEALENLNESETVTVQVTEAETEPEVVTEATVVQTTAETTIITTTKAAPVTAAETTAAPVITTTAAPVVTTTAAPVTTTTAAPVTTTPAPPVTTTTTEAVTEAPAEFIGPYNQRMQTAQEIEFCNRVFDLTNAEREKAGLPKLKKMTEITDMAVLRAWECTVSYSHTRPNGGKFSTALSGLDYHHIGENIAAGYTSAEAVVDGWMNSPTHRDNILNPDFEYLGVGCYYVSGDTYGYYWAQNFYTPF